MFITFPENLGEQYQVGLDGRHLSISYTNEPGDIHETFSVELTPELILQVISELISEPCAQEFARGYDMALADTGNPCGREVPAESCCGDGCSRYV